MDLDKILALVNEQRYFVLHARRQSGKTSTVLALADRLNREGRCRCVYANLETGQAAREDTTRAMRTILGELASRAQLMLNDGFVGANMVPLLEVFGPDGVLKEVLIRWSANDPTPLVLLLDEVDSLVGDSLISVLRQLRAGYDLRPACFPKSVVLCGVRDVRDYRIHSRSGGSAVSGGSALNIKAASLRLVDFTRGQVQRLLHQHVRETGQRFTDRAPSRTCGNRFRDSRGWSMPSPSKRASRTPLDVTAVVLLTDWRSFGPRRP